MTTHLVASTTKEAVEVKCGGSFRITRKRDPFADGDATVWASEVTCERCVPRSTPQIADGAAVAEPLTMF